jgi:hypothetical protein
MLNLLFLMAVSALLLHELDAIQQREWRFFLGWTKLSDAVGYQVFTAVHLPLFLLILALLPDRGFQIGFDLFMLLHALAHTLLRHHPLIRFNGLFSRLWIYGGAFVALLHLIFIITTG